MQVTVLGLLIARRGWQTDGWVDYRGRRRYDRSPIGESGRRAAASVAEETQ